MNNYKDQIRNETRCREISLQQIKVTEGWPMNLFLPTVIRQGFQNCNRENG